MFFDISLFNASEICLFTWTCFDIRNGKNLAQGSSNNHITTRCVESAPSPIIFSNSSLLYGKIDTLEWLPKNNTIHWHHYLHVFKVNFHLLNTGWRGNRESAVSLDSVHPFHKLSAQSLNLFEPLYLSSNLFFVIICSPQDGAPKMSYARHVVIEA